MSIILLFSPAALLFILKLFIPRAWDKVLWLGLLVTVCLIFFLLFDRPEDNLGFGTIIAGIQVVSLAISYAAAEVARFAYKLMRRDRRSVQSEDTRRLASLVFVGGLGGLIPTIFVFLGTFARLPGIALFVVMGIVAVSTLLASFMPRTRHYKVFLRGFTASLAAVLIFAVYTGTAVLGAAQRAAAGAPYCIQGGNVAVEDILDLTILNLRERGLGFHAILVVSDTGGPHFYNWSYLAWRWADTTDVNPSTICRPTAKTKP